ncbi:hypothetical protein BC939DRAFT_436335 [Gamsiella multidivaricata]|uniref:uncharacterized protein n=1 Tax=Gamsiella multidivaricata TaxID=101098 RepID=UPI00222019B5|nr:uncharacterized protein BC939DRAFT_436335 [Gamsiella multidivaricata]KAG0369655.1 hypothetical protein BGZ54_009304 [Gamsiella multidivaricata]KAI7831732.1 hypothetical protein BC939DRAFT_436335 [Gamsiella multidivaricata]
MDPSNQQRARLPPECIELIVQYLWDDISTLHTLLLCNRDYFVLVAPVLYRDPFRLVNQHRTWTREDKTRRTAYLMRILHACALTKPSQRDIQTNDFDASSSTSSTLWTATEKSLNSSVLGLSLGEDASQYGSAHIRASHGSPASADGMLATKYLTPLPNPLTIDYLFYYTHQGQIPQAFRAFQFLNPTVDRFSKGRMVFEQAFAKASMTLSLALYGHFPSRIRVLSMTPSQLGCILYKDFGGVDIGASDKRHGVEALRMLRRLELDFGATNSPMPRWAVIAPYNAGQSNEDWLAQTVDIPLEFIREHQQLFPVCPEDEVSSSIWIGDSAEGAPLKGPNKGTLLQELVVRGGHSTWTPTQLLTNIEPLKVVDLSAWNSDVPHLERIPSSRLSSLRMNIARRLEFVEVQLPYLQQCTQLQEVWMPCQAADTFQWAINVERSVGQFVTETRLRRRVATGVASTSIDDSNQAQDQPPHRFDPAKAPRMKKVRLYGGPHELIPCLEDAADAFRDTLEELAGYEDGYGRRDEYLRMSIDWPVPRLTHLDLRGRYVFFFDLRSLRHCPELRVVKLLIESNISSPKSTNWDHETRASSRGCERQDFSVFAEMKRLEELQLRGTSWEMDDIALETLMGGPGTFVDEDGVERHRGHLQNSLRYFSIPDAHLPRRAALTRFIQAMKKLEIIQLGHMRGYMADSLREAGAPRLFVEISSVA